MTPMKKENHKACPRAALRADPGDHEGRTKRTKLIFGALRAPFTSFVTFVFSFVPFVLPLFAIRYSPFAEH